MHTAADRRRLYAAAFLRAVATGLMGVLLGLYLARRGFDAVAIGLVIGSGISGAAAATLLVTFFGDRLGRRVMLIALAVLSALGGVALLATEHLAAVCAIAFLGMVNGAGRDRAAALALEQAMLPATTDDAGRTRAFAWYNVLQDAGHALGGLAAALPVVVARLAGTTELAGYGWTLGIYTALCLATGVLYLGLSPAIEARPNHNGRMPPLAPESRRVLRRISGLFAVDSLAGGFLGTALLSYFFFARFGAGEAAIATLFFLARVANGVSHLGAAWLAARIGLINTMVFTHIPSSLMLIAVALVPEFWMAATLFLVRELLVEMDVPTRQSYVMAVVRPEERTFASGVTSLVRLGGWAVAPFAAGFLMQGVALATPLLIGAGMKIGYDLLLWRSFRDLKPPEESASL
ncbi:MAG: MFS transporter [Sulfuricaulis sp.]